MGGRVGGREGGTFSASSVASFPAMNHGGGGGGGARLASS